MQYFESRLAARINEHRKRQGHFLERRFSAEPIFSDASEVERVVYLVCNAVQSGLISTWSDWPGITLWAHTGEPMEHSYEILDKQSYARACDKARRARKAQASSSATT